MSRKSRATVGKQTLEDFSCCSCKRDCSKPKMINIAVKTQKATLITTQQCVSIVGSMAEWLKMLLLRDQNCKVSGYNTFLSLVELEQAAKLSGQDFTQRKKLVLSIKQQVNLVLKDISSFGLFQKKNRFCNFES